MPTPPMQFSEYDRFPTEPTKSIGAFTDDILDCIGYTNEEITEMKKNGFVG